MRPSTNPIQNIQENQFVKDYVSSIFEEAITDVETEKRMDKNYIPSAWLEESRIPILSLIAIEKLTNSEKRTLASEPFFLSKDAFFEHYLSDWLIFQSIICKNDAVVDLFVTDYLSSSLKDISPRNKAQQEYLHKSFSDLEEPQQRLFIFLLLKKLSFNIEGKYLKDPISQHKFYFEHNTPFSTLVDGIWCALTNRPITVIQKGVSAPSQTEKNTFSLKQLIDLSKVLLLLQERIESMEETEKEYPIGYNELSISGQTLSKRIQSWRTHCMENFTFGLPKEVKEKILLKYKEYSRAAVVSLETVAGLDQLTNAPLSRIKQHSKTKALPMVSEEIKEVHDLSEKAGQSHHWQENPVRSEVMEFLTDVLRKEISPEIFEMINIPFLNLSLETSPMIKHVVGHGDTFCAIEDLFSFHLMSPLLQQFLQQYFLMKIDSSLPIESDLEPKTIYYKVDDANSSVSYVLRSLKGKRIEGKIPKSDFVEEPHLSKNIKLLEEVLSQDVDIIPERCVHIFRHEEEEGPPTIQAISRYDNKIKYAKISIAPPEDHLNNKDIDSFKTYQSLVLGTLYPTGSHLELYKQYMAVSSEKYKHFVAEPNDTVVPRDSRLGSLELLITLLMAREIQEEQYRLKLIVFNACNGFSFATATSLLGIFSLYWKTLAEESAAFIAVKAYLNRLFLQCPKVSDDIFAHFNVENQEKCFESVRNDILNDVVRGYAVGPDRQEKHLNTEKYSFTDADNEKEVWEFNGVRRKKLKNRTDPMVVVQPPKEGEQIKVRNSNVGYLGTIGNTVVCVGPRAIGVPGTIPPHSGQGKGDFFQKPDAPTFKTHVARPQPQPQAPSVSQPPSQHELQRSPEPISKQPLAQGKKEPEQSDRYLEKSQRLQQLAANLFHRRENTDFPELSIQTTALINVLWKALDISVPEEQRDLESILLNPFSHEDSNNLLLLLMEAKLGLLHAQSIGSLKQKTGTLKNALMLYARLHTECPIIQSDLFEALSPDLLLHWEIKIAGQPLLWHAAGAGQHRLINQLPQQLRLDDESYAALLNAAFNLDTLRALRRNVIAKSNEEQLDRLFKNLGERLQNYSDSIDGSNVVDRFKACQNVTELFKILSGCEAHEWTALTRWSPEICGAIVELLNYATLDLQEEFFCFLELPNEYKNVPRWLSMTEAPEACINAINLLRQKEHATFQWNFFRSFTKAVLSEEMVQHPILCLTLAIQAPQAYFEALKLLFLSKQFVFFRQKFFEAFSRPRACGKIGWLVLMEKAPMTCFETLKLLDRLDFSDFWASFSNTLNQYPELREALNPYPEIRRWCEEEERAYKNFHENVVNSPVRGYRPSLFNPVINDEMREAGNNNRFKATM